jgi:hypothetical protein
MSEQPRDRQTLTLYVGPKYRSKRLERSFYDPLLLDDSGNPRRDLKFVFPFPLLDLTGVIMPRPASTSPERRKAEPEVKRWEN